jgi:hypothetical protein
MSILPALLERLHPADPGWMADADFLAFSATTRSSFRCASLPARDPAVEPAERFDLVEWVLVTMADPLRARWCLTASEPDHLTATAAGSVAWGEPAAHFHIEP